MGKSKYIYLTCNNPTHVHTHTRNATVRIETAYNSFSNRYFGLQPKSLNVLIRKPAANLMNFGKFPFACAGKNQRKLHTICRIKRLNRRSDTSLMCGGNGSLFLSIRFRAPNSTFFSFYLSSSNTLDRAHGKVGQIRLHESEIKFIDI